MSRILISAAALLAAVPLAPAHAQAIVPSATPNADRLSAQMRILAGSPSNLDALIEAGRLSVKLGDPIAAMQFFARAERVSARDPRIAAGRGAALVTSERPGEALQQFAIAERGGVAPISFAADRGLAYDLLGFPTNAQADYRLALKQGSDAEVVRRLALSLGITGGADEAARLLDPLLRVNDRAAWRVRACVLAMAGDVAGANRIAQTMLPGFGPSLAPFFARLAPLGSADRAFAVHFGRLAPTPERLADARLAPPVTPLARPAPVALAARAPVPATAQAPARRQSAAERRREARAAAVQARQQRAAQQRESRALAARQAEAHRTAELQRRADAARQAEAQRVAAAQAAARQRETVLARARAQEAERREREARRAEAARPPVAVAALAPNVVPASSGLAGTSPAAPAAPVAATPTPAPTPAPVVVAAATAPVAVVESAPVAALAAPAPSLTGAEIAAATPVEAAPSSAPVASAPSQAAVAPAAAVTPSTGGDDVLARIIRNLVIPAAELGVAPMTPPASPPGAATDATAEAAPVETARAEPAAPARTAAAEKETPAKAEEAPPKPAATRAKPEARPKPEAKPKAEAKPKPKPAPAKTDPSRVWVQVAGGANVSDLPKAWRALGTKASALKGRSAWTTPLRFTNRLLTGPFKTEGEAQAFVNTLAKSGLSAFTFTSEAGQKVTKLPTP